MLDFAGLLAAAPVDIFGLDLFVGVLVWPLEELVGAPVEGLERVLVKDGWELVEIDDEEEVEVEEEPPAQPPLVHAVFVGLIHTTPQPPQFPESNRVYRQLPPQLAKP